MYVDKYKPHKLSSLTITYAETTICLENSETVGAFLLETRLYFVNVCVFCYVCVPVKCCNKTSANWKAQVWSRSEISYVLMFKEQKSNFLVQIIAFG